MPQMSPLWWTSLFVYFITLFLTVNIINYFIFQVDLKMNSLKKSSIKSFNWKW